MPTWDGPPPRKTRSPGASSDIETFGNIEYCIAALCGRLTPPASHARIVSPEQSYALGPAPPHRYGLPSCAAAKRTAACAPALTGPAKVMFFAAYDAAEARPAWRSDSTRRASSPFAELRSDCVLANASWAATRSLP